MSKLLIIYLFLHCISTFILCDGTLDEQNTQSDLDPVNDHENNEEKEKDQDKRTIFNSETDNYGWAKHVGVHPSGFRYVLGIGPVDLKYVPVIRNPFRVANRPRWPSKVFKPFRPVKHDHGWKHVKAVINPALALRPVVPFFRPVVPLVRPVGRPVFKPVVAHQWPNKSWQHDEWKQKPATPKPIVALTPVVPVVKPIPVPQAAPVVPVNPVVPLQPVNPVVSIQHVHPAVPVNQVLPFQHVNPVVHVQPAPPPVVPFPTTISTDPWVPLTKPAYPLVPQQPLFEVTKPNLPVLPLGASFPSPVLQQAPAGPGILFQKPQIIHQNPTPIVEFHGNHHHHLFSPNGYINFHKLASIQPQYAPQFTQTLPQNAPTQIFSTGVQIQQNPQLFQTPFDAGRPIHQFHQTVPQVTQVQQLPQPEQQFVPQVQQLPQPEQQFVPQVQQLPQPEQQFVPQVTQVQQQLPSPEQQYFHQATQFQQLPNQEQNVNQIQQFSNQGQQVDNQYLPPLAHGQLPLEGETGSQQQPQNPFIPNPQSNVFFQGQDQQFVNNNDIQQQFQSSNSIQPGQTDVQTPLYLPTHYTYNPSQVETFNSGLSSQFMSSQDPGFRPSAQLEPPYNNFGYNRREDVGEEEMSSVESST
ncbi:MAGE-like protein 2 isoform X2 [Harmonia axyridis]|uniref:MAGE-like protein 2 isoform X2 n=1 Tax=Harmonia axyridis TaxID=115357 RepID=UPI001E277627|nr:MAGE-like protein 2 isoform X2 [Harmonia axyridis]